MENSNGRFPHRSSFLPTPHSSSFLIPHRSSSLTTKQETKQKNARKRKNSLSLKTNQISFQGGVGEKERLPSSAPPQPIHRDKQETTNIKPGHHFGDESSHSSHMRGGKNLSVTESLASPLRRMIGVLTTSVVS